MEHRSPVPTIVSLLFQSMPVIKVRLPRPIRYRAQLDIMSNIEHLDHSLLQIREGQSLVKKIGRDSSINSLHRLRFIRFQDQGLIRTTQVLIMGTKHRKALLKSVNKMENMLNCEHLNPSDQK